MTNEIQQDEPLNVDPFYVWFLKNELEQRRSVSPRYSLRNFARDLQMDSATLSRVLNGKQPLSAKSSSQITQVIEMTAEEKEKFLASALEEKNSRSFEKVHSRQENGSSKNLHKVVTDFSRTLDLKEEDKAPAIQMIQKAIQEVKNEFAAPSNEEDVTRLKVRVDTVTSPA